jgi:3-dehydroquinate synthetase
MVDASIGGKTGIDTPYGKNLIGTFYHPRAIIADLETLQTLPEKERLNGLSEILKMGLIQDASLWKMAEQEINSPKLILQAIRGKISVLEQDPMERGLRRILNFGHSFAHGIETIAQYEMSHGEAVAIGCIVESHLSKTLGYLSAPDFERIRSLYQKFPLHLPKRYERKNLLNALSYDKKNAKGEFRFVLIDSIGHALPFDHQYCRPVAEQELESTLTWMEHHYA